VRKRRRKRVTERDEGKKKTEKEDKNEKKENKLRNKISVLSCNLHTTNDRRVMSPRKWTRLMT
jgi:hypothetical protein